MTKKRDKISIKTIKKLIEYLKKEEKKIINKNG